MFVRPAVTSAASGGVAGLVGRWLARLGGARTAVDATTPELPVERVAFLRDVHRLRVDEIARELGLSLAATERALFLARQRGLHAKRAHPVAVRKRSG